MQGVLEFRVEGLQGSSERRVESRSLDLDFLFWAPLGDRTQ